ncbi:hypothetical protein [Paludifilum halophilum]|uniref:PepSY domain-containing protein n=1 Tax=Paludifilum halophilum TaxID=1642702 RepID=A0A235B6B4_9BACL|nr:hypothetical protein [Paludifilum halophilum]OYD07830.1 hypothetical protein CHM34_10275 [Paludifilum halophilum]
MKKKELIISVVIFGILASLITYYLLSGGKTLNVQIPDEQNSAKELVQLAKPYVDDYWEDRKYYVGKITMELDKNHEGEVKIWYKDDRGKRTGEVANILTVSIDTRKNKILAITEQPSDSKIEPGIIHIDKWKVDSTGIMNIVKEAFKDESDFDYTDISIHGMDYYGGDKEVWDTVIFDDKHSKAYNLTLDPYTGEVLAKEIKDY